MKLVSGVGAKRTSTMALSGGKGLGPEGARRLADLLQQAPPPLLASLNLRHMPFLSRSLNSTSQSRRQ